MLKLPLDISSFVQLRALKYLYVDKTKYAYNLIAHGRRFFLARPRRFGKSLFVSMLKELLGGKKEIFEDLWIYNSDYSWKVHGVIVLDLSVMGIRDVLSFNKGMCYKLQEIADSYELSIVLDSTTPELALHRLVRALYEKYGAVAILIDEYDSPILNSLKHVDIAVDIRDALRNFFAAIKGLDTELDFVFITGVTSFSKAGIFSGMNNLRIISLQDNYAGICGYTEEEVDFYFSEHINVWAEEKKISFLELRNKIRRRYDGYHFSDNLQAIYNPFSVMNALEAKEFKNFWFQSGTPTFLVHELEKKYRQEEYRLFDPETFRASRELLASFDIGLTPLPALMFQTGYLTIRDYDSERSLYSLGYPNSEVQESMQKYLVSVFAQVPVGTVEEVTSDFELALQKEDIEEAVSLLRRLFMHVPYQLHVKEEKFYHALLHMVCNAYGMRVISEQAISHGRIDLVVALKSLIYVIEIKFNDSPENALKQIEEMRYYGPFIKENMRILLLGLSFNRSEKKFDITYAFRSLN